MKSMTSIVHQISNIDEKTAVNWTEWNLMEFSFFLNLLSVRNGLAVNFPCSFRFSSTDFVDEATKKMEELFR